MIVGWFVDSSSSYLHVLTVFFISHLDIQHGPRTSSVWLAYNVNKAKRQAQCLFCSKTITLTLKGASSNLMRHIKKDASHIAWHKELCISLNRPPPNLTKDLPFPTTFIESQSLTTIADPQFNTIVIKEEPLCWLHLSLKICPRTIFLYISYIF